MIASSIRLVNFEPVAYRGFRIKPIDHCSQPFWLDARWVTEGFIAISDTLGHCMPGAMWFRTVESARTGIDCFLAEGLDVIFAACGLTAPAKAQTPAAMAKRSEAVQRFHERVREAVGHETVSRTNDEADDPATQALLISEWVQFGDGGMGSENCPCCTADRARLFHLDGCVHDAALSKAGYITPKQRDDARARIQPRTAVPAAGRAPAVALTGKERRVLLGYLDANTRGAPFTSPRTAHHDTMVALSKRGFMKGHKVGSKTYWSILPAGMKAITLPTTLDRALRFSRSSPVTAPGAEMHDDLAELATFGYVKSRAIAPAAAGASRCWDITDAGQLVLDLAE